MPFQFFGGASFALIWSASVAYIDRHADQEMQTTGQALKSGVMSIGSSLSVLLGGYVYELFGSTVLFSGVAAVTFTALLLGVWLTRRNLLLG